MSGREQFDVRRFEFEMEPGKRYKVVKVSAGNRGDEWVPVPARREGGFWRKRWKREVEVYVSPTGRSVRVFVDGNEVPIEGRKRKVKR